MWFDPEYAAEIAHEYNLPEMPESGDGDRELFISFADPKRGSVTLTDDRILLKDAQEYCSRDDTHGPDWFIGYRQ
jgi:hypothetical protein